MNDMSTKHTLLEEALEYWYEVRRGFVRELKNIPSGRVTYRATLETRSIMELVQHMLGYSIVSIEELVREDTNFHRATYAQLANIYAPNIAKADSQESLVGLLAEQYKDGTDRLRALGELYMLQLIVKPNGDKGTRLSMLWDSIAHEQYHRAQLTVYERLLGLTPVLTQESPQPSFPSFTDRV
jgi:uncharacterized damage-inducible protein DinB